FVRESKFSGGLIAREDLSGYRAVVREPLRGSFRGHEIVTAAPPSSGGVALLEALNILQVLLEPKSAPGEVETLHLLAEALRRAFADRAQHLADTDFAEVPVMGLISKDYAAALAATISREKASPSASLQTPDPRRFGAAAASPADGGASMRHESDNTTHLSVMDAAGNAVALTTTLNDSFGNGITVPGLGFLLNNEMDDFAIRPQTPNAYGLVGGLANAVAPGKRMLSSMSPTFVEAPERIAILGTPGGSRIISMVLGSILAFADGAGAKTIVSQPRLHHQYLPDEVVYEVGALSDAEQATLIERGHRLRRVEPYGNLQAVVWDRTRNRVEAASDPRGIGQA
ncbi:MAG: gamma-glutamyltransferase family protein, partial [Nevskiales bacterium]